MRSLGRAGADRFQDKNLLPEKCHLGFASRVRSEQSNEQSAEQLQKINHSEARIAHRGICATPDAIFGSHRYISAIYADRFDSYAGQKLQVTGEQPAAAGVMVRSQIVKANGEPVNVDYMLHRSGAGWLISDIYLDGAISEVATRRSEFAAILKNEGIDGLIAALNRKADVLTETTARSF